MAEPDLYGLPLEEFTAARDAEAKRLREAGETDTAKAVTALRKPNDKTLNKIASQMEV